MENHERAILDELDRALGSERVQKAIAPLIETVEQTLSKRPDDVLAWEPIPLDVYCNLPVEIRSSWVFILRKNTVTGAERHPNSLQRMMSFRGSGDFQTRKDGRWESNQLASDAALPLEDRWISIPPNVWHQGVVPGEDWVVVSFHTARVEDLIEERPSLEDEGVAQRKYSDRDRQPFSTRDTFD